RRPEWWRAGCPPQTRTALTYPPPRLPAGALRAKARFVGGAAESWRAVLLRCGGQTLLYNGVTPAVARRKIGNATPAQGEDPFGIRPINRETASQLHSE